MKEFKQTFDEVFEAKYGKKDFKCPNVPADFLRNFPNICVRDGKTGLVVPDGKETELTEFVYDDIALVKEFVGTCLLYRKDGSKQFGIMANNGKEITPCNLDAYSETGQTIYFRSGAYWGLWQIETGELLEPIYDNIEIDNPEDATIFTLNGVKGYVKVSDHSFIPQLMKDTMSDDEWHDLLLECIRDQYIDD